MSAHQVTELRQSPYYMNTYVVVNFFVMTVLPVVILSVCHFLTFRKIRENTRMHNAISSHQGGRRLQIVLKKFFPPCNCPVPSRRGFGTIHR